MILCVTNYPQWSSTIPDALSRRIPKRSAHWTRTSSGQDTLRHATEINNGLNHFLHSLLSIKKFHTNPRVFVWQSITFRHYVRFLSRSRCFKVHLRLISIQPYTVYLYKWTTFVSFNTLHFENAFYLKMHFHYNLIFLEKCLRIRLVWQYQQPRENNIRLKDASGYM